MGPTQDTKRAFYAATGHKIYEARKRQHMTQEALASRVSLTRTSIVNIEKGKQQLLLHTLIDLARALKVEPVDLIPKLNQQRRSDLNVLLQDKRPKARNWIKSAVNSVGEES